MTTTPSRESDSGSATGLSELGRLMHRVQHARAAVDLQRSSSRSQSSNAEQLQLLEALESFAAALESRHLPVPPTIRDELQLQRGLATRSGVRSGAIRRRADRK